jgi:hypothetical protein
MAPPLSPQPLPSTPPTELLAAAWLAGFSSPKTRRTYRAMIRSWSTSTPSALPLGFCWLRGVVPSRSTTASCRSASLGSEAGDGGADVRGVECVVLNDLPGFGRLPTRQPSLSKERRRTGARFNCSNRSAGVTDLSLAVVVLTDSDSFSVTHEQHE